MDDRMLMHSIRKIIGSDALNDDCAVIPISEGSLVVSTDMLHEKTDFPASITDWQIGWMGVAVTLSDIAAMGAEPQYITLAIGLDKEGRLEEIIRGAADCCKIYNTKYIGGDLDAHQELTLVSTGIGMVREGMPVLRSGARPGDIVCVTGPLGLAYLGLYGDARYWKNLCEPCPRVSEGVDIRRAGATSMMDISDGLAISLYDLAYASEVSFEIKSGDVPLSDSYDRNTALHAALFGGGDFELLFTLPKERLDSLPVLTYQIGEVVVNNSRSVLLDGQPLEKRGYLHHWDT